MWCIYLLIMRRRYRWCVKWCNGKVLLTRYWGIFIYSLVFYSVYRNSRASGGHRDHADCSDTEREGGGGLWFSHAPSSTDIGHCSTLNTPAFIKQGKKGKDEPSDKSSVHASHSTALSTSAQQKTHKLRGGGKMAKSESQGRSLQSEEFFFDSDASLLDQPDFDMSSCPFNDVFSNSKDSHMEQINTFLKNVQVLLEAARFLESAERKDGSEFDLFCLWSWPFFPPN